MSRNPRKARRVTRAALTGVCAALLGLATVVPAHAGDPVSDNHPDRQYFGFIAPAEGQSVNFLHYQESQDLWSPLCFRWASGTNTGQPASTRSGLVMWNAYFRNWTYPNILGKPFRQSLIKFTLHSGDNCDGRQIGAEEVPPTPRPLDNGTPDNVYWVDFR